MSTTFDDRCLLVKRSKKLEKILGETPPSELIRPTSDYDTLSVSPSPVDTDVRRASLRRSRSRSRSSFRKLWNDRTPKPSLPRSAEPSTFLSISFPSSTDSILSTSSHEDLSVPPKITLPLDPTHSSKVAKVDHYQPRSPAFTPRTPTLRPRPNRTDSAISYFSLSVGTSTPSSPSDRTRTPTPTRDHERKRKVQNVSKLSRTLGECPKSVAEGIAGKKAPVTQVMIRQESRSLELASRGGNSNELASVSERGVLSDTEVDKTRPPPFARMSLGRKWIRDRGSKYYVEEDYDVIRNTLRMLR
ncbi:hypothetical protein NEOLEDRAFT_1130981 [Neolentinus lepideus HHB14362 ss-1]|uniref:Uncharacterized protein n=1 Tax=Neolentinus lepideus HHB14362 ss-1 TaxID=1314782 RepID=A0A165TZU5_9AGAM|nr:hypothetical protein NEOLEDRAFT_1130981 [Neolentinus lepideus HHB14362 ss-1]